MTVQLSSVQVAVTQVATSKSGTLVLVQVVAVSMVSLQTGMARRNGMVGAYLDRSPVFVLHITALSYGEYLGN